MFKAILVSLASLTALVGVAVTSASDDDFTVGTILDAPMSYTVAYVPSPRDILSYNPDTDICQYWSESLLGDWYYGYIENPLVTYELTFWSGGTRVVGCTSR